MKDESLYEDLGFKRGDQVETGARTEIPRWEGVESMSLCPLFEENGVCGHEDPRYPDGFPCINPSYFKSCTVYLKHRRKNDD